jgi:hypothetical protein
MFRLSIVPSGYYSMTLNSGSNKSAALGQMSFFIQSTIAAMIGCCGTMPKLFQLSDIRLQMNILLYHPVCRL